MLIGTGAAAVAAARVLVHRGVRSFVLADAGSRREEASAELRSRPSPVVAEGAGPLAAEGAGPEQDRPAVTALAREAGPELDRSAVTALVEGAGLVMVTAGWSFPAVHHWVNESGVPALHAAFGGLRARIGPLVLPGAGACFLCWRMRAVACEDDFAAAMALEEEGDRVRGFREPPPVPPVLSAWAGAVLAHEALAATVGPARPRLVGHVLELDGAARTGTLHPVLPRPDCPACARRPQRKGPAAPDEPHPAAAQASGEPSPTAPRAPDDPRPTTAQAPDEPSPAGATGAGGRGLAEVTRQVTSPLCGLVRRLDDVRKDPTEPNHPFIARAELSNARFINGSDAFVACSGKGITRAEARDGAIGEALERYAGLTWQPARQTKARRADLDGPSLDPHDLVLYADHQYAALPYPRYTTDQPLTWTTARSLATGGEVWVPLLAVPLAPRLSGPGEYLFAPTSNGLAAGSSTGDALRRALLEVVERDAFLIAWAHRLPGRSHDALDVPDRETRRVAAAYAARGVTITVHRLPTDAAAEVVLAIGWSDEPPAAVAGLGAHADPRLAARRAVLEVAQVRPALLARLRVPGTAARMDALAADRLPVTGLDDHDLRYAHPDAAAHGLHHLRSAPLTPWEAGTRAGSLVESLVAAAGDVLYADVTPADVAAVGVRVVRAIVPGFQPIAFGAAHARLGGRRLYELPERLGLRPGTATLNLDPHPLA
ncbi:TOMM precursor leader peptide-binding protein [Nonomuraea gerenzanensis]|uniref:TOMM precursor leader peptide-binding protein n=1 Tax=Nonomuraea gerenzanensis TaxID=93944 RepID=UPI001CDA304B|nr:TOMM precursor leader peptide-binding protein [Nonomuraea gerenzanensis]UBU09280.1 TOMM precursor leader peptide-binding protein [Nonomuraea gerenzanensis]